MPDSPRVCVVGSVNMDLVVRAPRLPSPGETVLGSAYKTYPGGKGANQAVAARRMGAATHFVGSIGDDPHGVRVRQALEAEGLDLSGLATRAGESTGLGLITVSDAGENMIVVAPGANGSLTPDDVTHAAEAIRAADVLLMQLEVPLACNAAAATIAREAGKCVMLNAAPARQLPPEFVKKVDVLVVNRGEGARLVGMDANSDPGRVALRLPELGPAIIVLTLGALGSILIHRGRPRRLAAPQVAAVDSTAAGDAFCGALAAMWAPVAKTGARSSEELSLTARAVVYASAAGALAATKAGAIPSLPKWKDVGVMAEKMLAGVS